MRNRFRFFELAFTPALPRWFEIVLVAAALLVLLCAGLSTAPFHPDESDWINTSAILEPFIGGDFAGPAWSESYWTLVQPPLARYLIGIGRRFGGYQVADLNNRWDWNLDLAQNTANGNVPSAGLLWWSRLPMAVLSAASLAIAFVLTSAAAGRPAGYLATVLLAANPFLLYTLRRAMSEAPLLAAVMLTGLVAFLAVRDWERPQNRVPPAPWPWGRALAWAAGIGLGSGLAGAAKLNGFSAGLVGALLVVLVLRTRSPHRGVVAVGIAVTSAGTALATFVSLYPFLYPAPIARTIQMFQFRFQEMQVQVQNPVGGVYGRSMDALAVLERVFQTYATLRFSAIVNILLGLVGLGYLSYLAWTWLRRCAGPSASVVLLLLAIASATPMLLTPLDWDRYFLLPVFFSTIWIAAGLSWMVAGPAQWLLKDRSDDLKPNGAL